jgi:hypothetical protein
LKCSRCPAESGRFKNCLACRRKLNANTAKWAARNPKAARRKNKGVRDRFIAAGKCGRCGVEPLASSTSCQPCLDDLAAYYRQRRPPMRAGRTCSACGQPGHMRNNHRCPKRYEVSVVEYATARQAA